MKCAHCHKQMDDEAAMISGTKLFHPDCCKVFSAATQGLPHKCPMCNGSGWEYDHEVPTIETFDPSFGYAGYFSPVETRVVMRRESKRCDLCNGVGFLAKAPTPILQPAIPERVMGWRKGEGS